MSTATTTRPATLAEAITAYRATAQRFAYCQTAPGELEQAEAALRLAGTDPATGLVSVPASVVRFDDVTAEGRRLLAANGSITGGPVWLMFSPGTGAARDYGYARDFGPGELIEVRGPGYRPQA